VRRFVLGTAGHVDHGKTALVRALTGVDTDRLPEEKRRGITIELGFAPLSLGEGVEVSVIDVPGHRRLVHTMIAGAIGMEAVLLVVAADEGVMPQTREHVAACELLGIRRAVIAVTKVDKAGAELARLAGDEAAELVAGRFDAEVALCSSRTGDGVGGVRDALRRMLLGLPARELGPRARLSVDRVFSVRGAGTVVTGTLVEGRLAAGAPLFVVGESGAIATAARGLHVHDRAVVEADAPTRLAVNLASVALEAVHRGDVVTDEGAVRATRLLDVAIRGAAPKPGTVAQLYVGTAHASARIDPVPAAEGEEGGPVLARIRLAKPMVVLGGDRFVLRGSDVDGPAGAVLGGGVVLDAHPPRLRQRRRRRAVLEALHVGVPVDVVRALASELSPRPLAQASLAARLAQSGAELGRAAEKLVEKGELARVRGPGYALRTALVELAGRARSLVTEHVRAAPLDRGMPLETLRRRLAALAGPEVAEEAIKLAAGARANTPGSPIVVEGDVARPSGAPPTRVGGAVGDALERAAVVVADAGLKGVTEHALGEATGATAKEVRAIFAKLVRDGAAAHVGDLWFGQAAVDALRARVREHLAAKGRLTIAEFKDMTGLGRRQSIPLLELFDREGTTKRDGDDRLPGK
jgi:selenocysteine-specific elongation factor